jgi:hypothetical protein
MASREPGSQKFPSDGEEIICDRFPASPQKLTIVYLCIIILKEPFPGGQPEQKRLANNDTD